MNSGRTVILLIGFAISLLLSFIALILQKRSNIKGRYIGNILLSLIIPAIFCVGGAYISSEFFGYESNSWDENITANDEKVMIEEGYDNFEEYYVRIVESDEKLTTGVISTYFQRIDTTRVIKPEKAKYRYIELINKENGTIADNIIVSDVNGPYDDNSIKSVLRYKSNSLDNYIETWEFYSKNGTGKLTGYIYREDNIQLENYVNIELNNISENIYLVDAGITFMGDGKEKWTLSICSDKELPTGNLTNGFYRKYVGKKNFISTYENIKKQMFCYEQTCILKEDDSSIVVPIIDRITSPELFETEQKEQSDWEKSSIILSFEKPEDKIDRKYVYINMNLIMGKHSPLFTYNVYVRKGINCH